MKDRIGKVKKRIHACAASCGRDPESVRLVAVSKTMPTELVQQAIDHGVAILGENYIQEARTKFNDLYESPVKWHFIGHLQSNKAKYATRIFDLIHSVDSIKLAKALDKSAAKQEKIQKILVQVNISEEATKSGAREADTLDLIKEIATLPHISVKGLMTMPPFFDQPERARPYFKQLAALKQRIQNEHIQGVVMEELSMGMTGDFEVAIQEGATLVRIGTAIFGERR